MKETIIHCDCCGDKITTKTIYEPRDIINTGSHIPFTEQLFKSENDHSANVKIKEMKELCLTCKDALEQSLKDVLIATIARINYKEPK